MLSRITIGVFGLRNAGKSSLINLLVGQQVSIVSDVAGTTTDPVSKPIEINGLGACVFIDTPGYDDEGKLGAMRVTHQTSHFALRHSHLPFARHRLGVCHCRGQAVVSAHLGALSADAAHCQSFRLCRIANLYCRPLAILSANRYSLVQHQRFLLAPAYPRCSRYGAQ